MENRSIRSKRSRKGTSSGDRRQPQSVFLCGGRQAPLRFEMAVQLRERGGEVEGSSSSTPAPPVGGPIDAGVLAWFSRIRAQLPIGEWFSPSTAGHRSSTSSRSRRCEGSGPDLGDIRCGHDITVVPRIVRGSRAMRGVPTSKYRVRARRAVRLACHPAAASSDWAGSVHIWETPCARAGARTTRYVEESVPSSPTASSSGFPSEELQHGRRRGAGASGPTDALISAACDAEPL